MTQIKGFRGLNVWQKGKALAVKIYEISSKGRFGVDHGLRDQMRRAAVSIPSNIAEGDSLGTDKQSIRHFNIAKGSSAELLTQAEIACEIGYLSKETLSWIEVECHAISGMLQNLISARSKSR
jgi:four helix bundle protein